MGALPRTPIYVVDAFAAEPFRGNPAAVCMLHESAGEEWMQSVAAEMKHAETAFLWPLGANEPATYHLRWFTPTCEVDLCGHATLAAAHVIYEQHLVPSERDLIFHTKSGPLKATRPDGRIELDFPAEPVAEAAPPEALARSLGAVLLFVGRNRMDWLVQLSDEDAVRALRPDFASLAAIPSRGVIVTARGTDFDFVSRFFAPASGVPEDDVTGSAHCALAPYWSAKLGKSELVGYQASSRGGIVGVALRGDRVLLRGSAVTILAGLLHIQPNW